MSAARMNLATVIGGQGYVGRRLVAHLRNQGTSVFVPGRDDPALFSRPLGDVFYCAGVTADFRSRPLAAVEAHVCLLRRVLAGAAFDRLLYLSSSRVYGAGVDGTHEEAALRARPGQLEDLYNLSKLTGEAACHASGRPTVVVRLSNVAGPLGEAGNFLDQIAAEAAAGGPIRLRSAAESAKDYIHVDDVVEMLPRLIGGRERTYNLAAGTNLAAGQVAATIADAFGVDWCVAEGAALLSAAPIDITRIVGEFAFAPRPVLPALAGWATDLRQQGGQ